MRELIFELAEERKSEHRRAGVKTGEVGGKGASRLSIPKLISSKGRATSSSSSGEDSVRRFSAASSSPRLSTTPSAEHTTCVASPEAPTSAVKPRQTLRQRLSFDKQKKSAPADAGQQARPSLSQPRREASTEVNPAATPKGVTGKQTWESFD